MLIYLGIAKAGHEETGHMSSGANHLLVLSCFSSDLRLVGR